MSGITNKQFKKAFNAGSQSSSTTSSSPKTPASKRSSAASTSATTASTSSSAGSKRSAAQREREEAEASDDDELVLTDGTLHVIDGGARTIHTAATAADGVVLLTDEVSKKATHDHQHLAAVTRETLHLHSTEEVERAREVDRHVHHLQHHIQPLMDTQHTPEKRIKNNVAITEIQEAHIASEAERARFAALKTSTDSYAEVAHKKRIIDSGETVRERVHHHVHHVVQPEVVREIHQYEHRHTYIPVRQITHEAPVIHQTTVLAPLSIEQYLKSGGNIKSTVKHDYSLLNFAELAGISGERVVKGPGETLISDLGLSRTKIRAGTPLGFEESYLVRAATPV
ncbi:hypothetical protein JCM6882_009656 [Rhodosporidiobolus microsporus]